MIERLIERCHEFSPVADQRYIGRARGDPAGQSAGHPFDSAIAVAAGRCHALGEFGPADRIAVGQVPQARRAIDQQIENGIGKLRHEGGGNHVVCGCVNPLSGGKRLKHMNREIVNIVG